MTYPPMMMNAICMVKGITLQKPEPKFSAMDSGGAPMQSAPRRRRWQPRARRRQRHPETSAPTRRNSVAPRATKSIRRRSSRPAGSRSCFFSPGKHLAYERITRKASHAPCSRAHRRRRSHRPGARLVADAPEGAGPPHRPARRSPARPRGRSPFRRARSSSTPDPSGAARSSTAGTACSAVNFWVGGQAARERGLRRSRRRLESRTPSPWYSRRTSTSVC